MPGAKSIGFNQGDVRENLAYYLLSCIGLALPVLRQVDIGTDFICNISHGEGNLLIFEYPFTIQIKSTGEMISYGGFDKKGHWKKYEIDWLFKQKLPFFIGIIDPENNKLSIYTTSSMWFAYCNHSNSTKISLNYRLNSDENHDVGRPTINPLELDENVKETHGDGNECVVDIGIPICVLDVNNVKDSLTLFNLKNALREYIDLEQKNITLRRLHVPYFRWNLNSSDSITGWITEPLLSKFDPTDTLSEIAPIILTLIAYYQGKGMDTQLKYFKQFINLLPHGHLPAEIYRLMNTLNDD